MNTYPSQPAPSPSQSDREGVEGRAGGHAWAWIAAYAAMTWGWARFIVPLQENPPLRCDGDAAWALVRRLG